MDIKRFIDLIIIHCAATPNGRSVDAADIDRWHAARGFKRYDAWRQKHNPSLAHIGYHFVIGTDGSLMTGRHLDEIGAHARGYNERSLGICMAGTDKFTAAQWQTLRQLMLELYSSISIPSLSVVGHRDLSVDLNGDGVIEPQEWMKECPGFDVTDWLMVNMLPLEGHVL
jgi:hypothetical protein